MHHVLFSLMRSMRLQDSVEPAWEAVMNEREQTLNQLLVEDGWIRGK